VRPVSDAQVKKLMEEMSKHGQIGQAAMKADMDRKTARKYVVSGKLPSELKQPRDWRTRPDPFEAHWPEIEARLRETPAFEAKTLFELLQQQHPGRYEDGQLRTLQRHVKRWRAAHGLDREVQLDHANAVELSARGPVELSAREREVLCWAQQGKTYWEIGCVLGISQRTVKFHFARIKAKLDVVSTAHAIAKAMRTGLLP